MKKTIRIIIIVAIAIVGYLYFTQNAAESNENPEIKTIKIGAILPLTGNSAFIGNWHKEGIELALADLDTLDIKVEIVYVDSKNNAKDGINAYKLLKTQNIDVIFSAMSSVSLALQPIIDKDKIEMFATAVSYPDFASKSKYSYRYNITSKDEAEFAANNISDNDVSVYYINDQYGLGALNSFVSAFKEKNKIVSYSESFNIDQNDFKNTLAKFDKNSKVYVAGYGRSYVTLMSQLIQRTKTDTIYSVYGMDFPEFRKPLIGNNNVVGYTRPKRIKSSLFANFENSFIEKNGKEPNLIHVLSYDLIHIIKNYAVNKRLNNFGTSLYGYELNVDNDGEINVPLEFVYFNLNE